MRPALVPILFPKTPGWVRAKWGLGVGVASDFKLNRHWDYRFGSQTLEQMWALTRTTSEYAVDSTGTWTQFASGVFARTDLGLYDWEARTNLFLQSADITNAAWTKFRSTASTSGSVLAPDGGFAKRLTEDVTAANNHGTQQSIAFTNGVTYTFSVFVRPDQRTWCYLTFPGTFTGGLTQRVYFNATGSGTVGTIGAGITAAIKAYANGWYVVSGTMAAGASTSTNIPFAMTTADNTPTYDGDGVSGLYVWNQQFEAGASATPPIVTAGSTVTRNADVITMRVPPVFGGAYSMYAKGTPQSPVAYGTSQFALMFDDGSTNNRFSLTRLSGTGSAQYFNASAGSLTTVGSQVFTQGASGKFAAATAAGSQAVSYNGITPDVGTAALPIGVANVRLGSNQSGVALWDGTIEELAIWPTTRVPNVQLQGITTP